VFEKDQKKNSKPFRGHLAQNSVGGGEGGGVMENQAKCLKNDEKSIYIYILAKFSWGGGKSGRVFEILEKKNSRAPAGT